MGRGSTLFPTMSKGGRVTLLIVPEEGGKTFELKIPRIMVGLGGIITLAVLVIIVAGIGAFFKSRQLGNTLAGMQDEYAQIEHKFDRIEQLEQVLSRLQKSNRQLRAILGESANSGISEDPPGGSSDESSYVSSVERLRLGHIHSVPSLWPGRGVVTRNFSRESPGVVIAVPLRSPIRASAAGQVVMSKFDKKLGYVVELDHGSGIVSQYGYNSHLLVARGDYVQKGQVVALSGNSGEASSPALYFDVRENGQSRDPLLYRLWL